MTLKKLMVIYEGWGARWPWGHLSDDGERVLFEYTPEALSKGLELSPLHLPLQTRPFDPFLAHQDGLPGIVSDALPDGWGRVVTDRLFRKMKKDLRTLSPLDRLAFVGGRAIGALTFEPASEEEGTINDLSWVELSKKVESILLGQGNDVLKEMALLGGSPQGTRPKVLVWYDPISGRLSNGGVASGEPWLVKFPGLDETKESSAVEKLYADLLSQNGIDVMPTRFFDLDPQRGAFGTKRFDREGSARVPTHTLAGLLHADQRVPSVGYLDFLKVTRFLTRDEREVKKAFERCVFNVLFNNRDDHARNFSFRMDVDGAWRLAPAYDVTYVSGEPGGHRMGVMGETRSPGKRHLLALAEKAGVSGAKKTLESFCDGVHGMKQLGKNLPIRRPMWTEIWKAVQANRDRLS